MGTVTLAVLLLTVFFMLFGALLGLIRGRERALLRFLMVLLAAVLAFLLRGVVVDAVMELPIEGVTLRETIAVTLATEAADLPVGLLNFLFSLVEILLGFVLYFVLFYGMKLFGWILPFPLLKLAIRKKENKAAMKLLAETPSAQATAEDGASATAEAAVGEKLSRKERRRLVKRHRGLGALVGLLEGLLVAYLLLAPLSCLAVQVAEVASIKLEGEALLPLPEEVDLAEYAASPVGKAYGVSGRWLYRALTTVTDADGNEVSLEGTIGSIVVLSEVMDATASLEADLAILGDENAEPEEVVAALDALGDRLLSVGGSMESLDAGFVYMIKDLASEMAGEDISADEMDEMLEMLTPEFFMEAGNGLKAFAAYEQTKLDGAAVTEDAARDIVEKAHGCIALAGGIELEIREEDKDGFKSAIDTLPDVTAEDKDALYALFGIEAITP